MNDPHPSHERAAGWFPDPFRRYRVRYWDGAIWTQWVADAQRPFKEPPPDDRKFRRWAVGAVVAVGVCTPVAASWAIGDRSFQGRPADQLDYMYRVPDVPSWVTAAFGLLALIVLVLAVAALTVGVAQRRLNALWLRSAGLLFGAGVILGFVGRVTTAGSVGANIGGVIALFPGLAAVGVLVGFAARDVYHRLTAN